MSLRAESSDDWRLRWGVPILFAVPDDLYDRDVLAWSEHQADLLRRLARGERVNDLDWEHVVEEIEGVGLSELHAVESCLSRMLVHLLNLGGWPECPAVNHWRVELAAFQKDAARRYSPSMRQRINLESLYADAVDQLDGIRYDDRPPRPWPNACPFTLGDLLHGKRAALAAMLAGGSAD